MSEPAATLRVGVGAKKVVPVLLISVMPAEDEAEDEDKVL